MSSLIPGYNYDIFISYRQKDNKHDGWVTEFVDNLKGELESTFKEEISVYFDINPHDGLLETHDVDESLKDKLKCLIFIPIISRTYCDPKSFAWEHEFKAFVEQASDDQFGLKVKLPNGNVASRVLPISIYDLDPADIDLCESVLGSVLRGIDFIYAEPGVNRPLKPDDDEKVNLNKTKYRNQINKVGNAIKDIFSGLQPEKQELLPGEKRLVPPGDESSFKDIEHAISLKLSRRILPAGIAVISIIVIVILIFYPRLFKKNDSLASMTFPVTVMNEYGEKEQHRVLRKEYITNKLKVLPFNNETGDSTKNWMGFGIRDALYEDFLQFNYMVINQQDVELAYISFFSRDYYDIDRFMDLQEKIKRADEDNCPYFLTGKYTENDGYFEVSSQLYETSSGSIKNENTFIGNDLFGLVDSISLQTRRDLGVDQIILNSTPDLPVGEITTNNLDAFCKYIEGMHDLLNNGDRRKIRQAVDIDTTFVIPLIHLAFNNLFYQAAPVTARKDINQTMRHRERLSEYRNIETRIIYYRILGEIEKAVRLMEMSRELQPYNSNLLEMLYNIYDENGLDFKAMKTAEEFNKLFPDNPTYQLYLIRAYLLTGRYKKGFKLVERVLETNPDNIDALLSLGELYLRLDDYEAAEEMYNNLIIKFPEQEPFCSLMLEHIEFARVNEPDPDFLKKLPGLYRANHSPMKEINYIIDKQFLANRATTQGGLFLYPVSDTQFVFVYDHYAMIHTYIRDDEGEIIKYLHQENRVDPRAAPKLVFWKQDSLITNAEKLLASGKHSDALVLFKEACASHPEHYYIENYIKHIEFYLSPEYNNYIPVFDSYAGDYSGPEGDLKIIEENGRYYYRTPIFRQFEILPLTKDLFMVPDSYLRTIQFFTENGSVTGFKIIYREVRGDAYFSRVD